MHTEEEAAGCRKQIDGQRKPLSGVRNVYAKRKGVFTKMANKLILLAFYKKNGGGAGK